MKQFTATQLHDLPNDVFNEATKAPVPIDHRRRGIGFVLMTQDHYDEMLNSISELVFKIKCLDKK